MTSTGKIEQRPIMISVDASVCGPLAVHLSVGDQLPRWTITHVPTGCAMAWLDDRGLAVEIARVVADIPSERLPGLDDGDREVAREALRGAGLREWLCDCIEASRVLPFPEEATS